MQVASVNVNGIRAAARKGFGQWLAAAAPDVLLMQEVRAPEEITRELVPESYQLFAHPSEIAGRAGVAVAVRKDIAVGQVRAGLHAGLAAGKPEEPVDTGRWLEVDLPELTGAGELRGGVTVVSAYLHSGVAGDPAKMAAKYSHLERVTARLEQLNAVREHEVDPAQPGLANVLVAGDFNIVRTALDIKNWKGNHNKTSGVLDAEISYLDRWFGDLDRGGQGWVDAQRALIGPEAEAPYTWWSNRGQAFDRNVGWRIDYQMVTPGLAAVAREARVDRAASYAERWSDHAPLVVGYAL